MFGCLQCFIRWSTDQKISLPWREREKPPTQSIVHFCLLHCGPHKDQKHLCKCSRITSESQATHGLPKLQKDLFTLGPPSGVHVSTLNLWHLGKYIIVPLATPLIMMMNIYISLFNQKYYKVNYIAKELLPYLRTQNLKRSIMDILINSKQFLGKILCWKE